MAKSSVLVKDPVKEFCKIHTFVTTNYLLRENFMNSSRIFTVTAFFMFSSLTCSDSPSSKVFTLTPSVRLGSPTTLQYVDGAQMKPVDIIALNPAIATTSIKETLQGNQLLIQICHQYHEHVVQKDTRESIWKRSFTQLEQGSQLCCIASISGSFPTQKEIACLQAKATKRLHETAQIRNDVGARIVPNKPDVLAKFLSSRLVVAHGLTHVTVYPLLPAKQKEDYCSIS